MVWISKREIAYYIILRKAFNNRTFNLGEALDILSLFGSKNIGRKTIKKLVKKGFIEKVDELNYNVVEIEKAFEKLLNQYMMQRLFKNLKSKGYNVKIDVKNNSIVLTTCDQTLEKVIKILNFISLSVECREYPVSSTL